MPTRISEDVATIEGLGPVTVTVEYKPNGEPGVIVTVGAREYSLAQLERICGSLQLAMGRAEALVHTLSTMTTRGR